MFAQDVPALQEQTSFNQHCEGCLMSAPGVEGPTSAVNCPYESMSRSSLHRDSPRIQSVNSQEPHT